MVSSVSGSSAVFAAMYAQTAQAAPPPQQQSGAPQDTVHLSSQALAAAGGDADHDGDSH